MTLEQLTPLQIANANRPTNCSACGAREVRVIETRANNQAIRRRKQCLACKHRETTYEISQAQYHQLQTLDKLRAVLLGTDASPIKTKLTCLDCTYWKRSGCDMGFPEAGGAFAGECSCYQNRLDHAKR
jgi:hypothetical protein